MEVGTDTSVESELEAKFALGLERLCTADDALLSKAMCDSWDALTKSTATTDASEDSSFVSLVWSKDLAICSCKAMFCLLQKVTFDNVDATSKHSTLIQSLSVKIWIPPGTYEVSTT
mmetsp:Transcript_78352/g.123718  ORF Transcript_78352/g.123718 Transcript_78352/m.123718 type:complete len:117 (-) Transcript_78352:39-389(-)